jgi:hypothetical protein
VLDADGHLEAIGAELRAVRPMPAAFDPVVKAHPELLEPTV